MTIIFHAVDDEGCELQVNSLPDAGVYVRATIGLDRVDVALNQQQTVTLLRALTRALHPSSGSAGSSQPGVDPESARAVASRLPSLAARALRTVRGRVSR